MMHALNQPLASAMRPSSISIPSEKAIKTAMAAGLGSSLVLLCSLQIHGFSTHILKQAGLSQFPPSPPPLPPRKASISVCPEHHDENMGNRFSKEKRHSKRYRTSSPTEKAPLLASHNRPAPNPASSAGPLSQAVRHKLDHYHDKIDPREDRYRRPAPSSGTNNSLPSRPATAASSYSSSGTLPRAAKPLSSAFNPKPWKGNGNGKAAANPKEYQLQIRCTYCDHHGRYCDVTPDLNVQNNSAYDIRNPHYDGDPKIWKLHIDFCSVDAQFLNRGEKRKKAEDVLKRFIGDRTYGDIKEEREPFCVQDLLTRLKSEGVVVLKSVPDFPR
jgi:hypothetical protein